LARNIAITEAHGEILAFIDDDCEADPNWLAVYDAAFDPDIGFASGSVVAPPAAVRWLAVCPAVQPADRVFDPEVDGMPPDIALIGANMAVRRADAECVGGFDERMGAGSIFQGGEEHDFVCRLGLAKVKMRGVPTAVVHHTYGVRRGIKAIMGYRRERVRGDGAFAAKCTMLQTAPDTRTVRACVVEYGAALVRSTRWVRIPLGLFRILHSLVSYHECLRGFAIAGSDPINASLVERPSGEARRMVAGALGLPRSTAWLPGHAVDRDRPSAG